MMADGPVPPHQPHCLGCGTDNPASLKLRMRVADGRVFGTVQLDRRHEGAPGFAHGGAVATVLDDALGTVLIVLERPAVTAHLAVDYRAPVLLGRRLSVEAWAESIDGRKLHLAAVLRDGEVVVAESQAMFVAVDIEHFRLGGSDLPERWGDWLGQRGGGA